MKFGALLRETAGEEPDLQALFTCARDRDAFLYLARRTALRGRERSNICVSISYASRAALSVLSPRFWYALNARQSTAVHLE